MSHERDIYLSECCLNAADWKNLKSMKAGIIYSADIRAEVVAIFNQKSFNESITHCHFARATSISLSVNLLSCIKQTQK